MSFGEIVAVTLLLTIGVICLTVIAVGMLGNAMGSVTNRGAVDWRPVVYAAIGAVACLALGTFIWIT